MSFPSRLCKDEIKCCESEIHLCEGYEYQFQIYEIYFSLCYKNITFTDKRILKCKVYEIPIITYG